MSRNSYEHLAVLERRRNVAARYLRGEPQYIIARAFEVDAGTISRDLTAIRNDWMLSALRDFDAAKAQELAKIDEVERAAWMGWSKSQENAETLQARMKSSGSETSKTTKGQAGNPRFLQVILDCIARRCAILGIDAEQRIKLTGSLGVRADDRLDLTKLTDAQLDQFATIIAFDPPKPGGEHADSA